MGKRIENVNCSVCGLSSEQDKNFHKKDKLCNRHWLQIKRHGKPMDNNMINPLDYKHLKNCCDICGDTESVKYYIWHRGGEYHNKELCNKHYNQLIRHGYLLDTEQSKHLKRHKWCKEEDIQLEELYEQGLSLEEISKKMNMDIGMISSRSCHLKLGEKYMRSNNPNFKALYQDYDWCYERYIVKGMSHQEMADECGASLRVIQKWCSEIHRLNGWTFKKEKTISDIQYQIILFGTLGDGHIDKREDQPIYIESHAIDEKDYCFWKYEQLKDLCNSPPKYYPATYNTFGSDKKYYCLPYYRFETRIINQLKEIRSMKRINKIEQLNIFGLVLHVLDDGNRGDLWNLCLAEYTQEEIDTYIKLCKERFDLVCWQKKDIRYISFDANSSRKIDSMILDTLPNDLDIIKKKVLNNTKITTPANYVYVISDTNIKMGLNTYCRSNKISYKKTKEIVNKLNITEITEKELLQLLNEAEVKYAV